MKLPIRENGLSGTAWVGPMSDDEYHADPCRVPSLSASMAKVLDAKSPAHAFLLHPRLGGERSKPTAAMERGTVMHAGLLGTGNDHRMVIPEGVENYKTKVAQEMRDAIRTAGKIPVLFTDEQDNDATVRALKRRMGYKGVHFSDGKAEQVIIWEEVAGSGRKVQCRAKVDYVQGHVITDLKSCVSAAPEEISTAMARYRYPVQAAAYTSGLSAVFPELAGTVEFRWVFFESAPPFAVSRVRPSEQDMDIARAQWQRAIDVWDACMHAGAWPDYDSAATADPMIIETPYWYSRAQSYRFGFDDLSEIGLTI